MFLLHFRFRRKYRFSCAVQMFARYKFDKAILPRVLESREEWYSYSSPRARLPAGTGNDAVRSANGRIKRYPSVWIPDVFSFLFFSLFPLFFLSFFRGIVIITPASPFSTTRVNDDFSHLQTILHEDRFKTRLFFRKKENLVSRTLSIFLLSFSSLSRIFHPRSIEIEISRGASKNIFRKYFEKEDIPGYIYSRNNKQRNKAHIPGNIGRYIFEKAKKYFVREKNVENTRVSATIFPPRENRPSTLFARRTWQRHNCSFSLQPLSFFPPSTLCVKALRQSPVRCTRTGRVRKLGLGRYRSSHQFTTSGQRRN